MDYKIDGKDILLCQADFDLDQTLDCGQAFRWEKTDENTYSGAFLNKKLVISCENGADVFRLHDTTEEDFLSLWADYFDLSTDYSELKRRFSEDETLSKACRYASGIRILRQHGRNSPRRPRRALLISVWDSGQNTLLTQCRRYEAVP